MKYLLEGEETKRLIFRLVRKDDFEWWLRFVSNPESLKYFGFDKKLTPLEITNLWFDKVFDRYKNNLGGLNVLIEKSSGMPVGQCGLLVQEVDNITELEIGYSLCPEFWGKGYATEAAIKCRNFAFENNFAESIISIVHIENIKSQNVALRNDMKFEKRTEFKNIPVNIYRIKKGYK
ncbi:MAG: GNAT family N-acetyltransferase [Prolixibacteraceae bacterium]|nr:GNAT family N-acetyltransferase [Prolixibacteraceae bacterium]